MCTLQYPNRLWPQKRRCMSAIDQPSFLPKSLTCESFKDLIINVRRRPCSLGLAFIGTSNFWGTRTLGVHLGNETFEGEQSLPTQECKQSVPLKKGFAAVATYSNPLLLPLNTKIELSLQCRCKDWLPGVDARGCPGSRLPRLRLIR